MRSKDFALSAEQALPVLKTWNRTNCRPAWPDEQLLHKLRKAAESPGPRGRLLDAMPTTIVHKPIARKVGEASGRTFHATVPDWVEYIWAVAVPRQPTKQKGRPTCVTARPCRILQAATHELTRARSRKAQRPDHGELVPGTDHPLLDGTKVYVGFNGNGSRKRPQFHGRGFVVLLGCATGRSGRTTRDLWRGTNVGEVVCLRAPPSDGHQKRRPGRMCVTCQGTQSRSNRGAANHVSG